MVEKEGGATMGREDPEMGGPTEASSVIVAFGGAKREFDFFLVGGGGRESVGDGWKKGG